MLICESCDKGYDDCGECPWCGASVTLAHAADRVISMVDTECAIDYWLCKFDPAPADAVDFQLFPGHPLDIEGLIRALSRCRVITFNGNKYDIPMIALALTGADNATLKQANDEIIKGNLQPWQFYDRWGIREPYWIDTIDLIEVAPGGGSLKMYGGKMHSKTIQDLPFDPAARFQWHDRASTREYCQNDLDTTGDLWRTFPAQIALREQMSAEYGVDVRSKSDAQIAETVMKKLLPMKVYPPEIPPGTTFYYQPPAYLRFQTLDLLALLARSPFVINATGNIDMTAELENTHIRIGNSTYRMGIGGLHSSESGAVHYATIDESLQDVDVVGYYPLLIINLGIEPPQLAGYFSQVYRTWYAERTAAKKAGNKKVANSRKTLNNGTFGKLNSKYSVFYYPQGLIQVTITGQLSLLMLIELLELSGIPVVSANTDGIVIKCPRPLEWLRDQIVAYWCQVTAFETEAAEYRMIASRDVNSYVAIKTDGEVKLKGAYAPPEPGPSGWPNPTGQVCVDAIVAKLKDGVPLEHTIRMCTDIRRFVHIRAVKGGGEWVRGPKLERTTTQTAMRAALGWAPGVGTKEQLQAHYEALRARADREYLGKAVRWYYAVGDNVYIAYTGSGNTVATSEGCRPCMTLPDALPADIDYDRYIADARALLADLGVQP